MQAAVAVVSIVVGASVPVSPTPAARTTRNFPLRLPPNGFGMIFTIGMSGFTIRVIVVGTLDPIVCVLISFGADPYA